MRLIITKLFYDIPIILLVVFIGGIIFYFSIKRTLENNTREVLELRKEDAIKLINSHEEKELLNDKFGNIYDIYRETPGSIKDLSIFKDTLIYDAQTKQLSLYRELNFRHCKNNICYRVSVRKPLVDYHLIFKTIVVDIVIISIIMAIALITLNLFISKKIWEPFYNTLTNFSDFDLDSYKKLEVKNTTIIEFQKLNATLEEITQRLQAQYNDLKDFTSYLTHELQTPLAIIKAHADLLLQTENLTEEQLKSISVIKNTVKGISLLEEALILIKRIELGEFDQKEQVNFKATMKQKIEQMDELMRLKEISYTTEFYNELPLNAHPQLIDTLLNNVISNSIRHNVEGGYIAFSITANKLQIKNSFKNKDETIDNLQDYIAFKGLGLGLSIVKSICKKYDYVLIAERVGTQEFHTTIYFI